jgi:hypothetical protein
MTPEEGSDVVPLSQCGLWSREKMLYLWSRMVYSNYNVRLGRPFIQPSSESVNYVLDGGIILDLPRGYLSFSHHLAIIV